MPPLGSIFRSGTSRPKVDQHSLFTSIQVSVPVLQGTLQIYEPWKKKRVKARACHVTLYANDTSPFLVWSKACNPASGKSPVSPTSHSVTGPTNADAPSNNKPRCVLPVSRAKVTKTTGGCFEVVDFATSSLFRFVAPTIRESEMWVERLKTESQREANLDMGSICSNCSSSSSSHPSPVSNEYGGFFSSSPSTPTAFPRAGYNRTSRENSIHHTSSSASDSANLVHELGIHEENDNEFRLDRPTDLPVFGEEFGNTADFGGASDTFSRSQGVRQRHTRAQPHLGANLHTVDKQRPDLGNLLRNTSQGHRSETEDRSKLPFSEYFVNLPST